MRKNLGTLPHPPYDVTLIIPAYNEEKTIGDLLRRILDFEIVKELIVVDDGSTDKTAETVYNVFKDYHNRSPTQTRLISYPQNRGKAYAICRGIEAATYEVVMFCDADLVSIEPQHISNTVLPLLLDLADAVLAIRETDKFPFQTVTGERAYRKSNLLPLLKDLETLGRGMEIFLNRHFEDKRAYYFISPGLIQTGKGNNLLEKMLALDDYLRELIEISKGYIKTKEELKQLTDLRRHLTKIIDVVRRNLP